MSGEKTQEGGQEGGQNSFDPKEILNQMSEMKSSILSEVREVLSASKAEKEESVVEKKSKPNLSSVDSDIKSEVERLGLDEDQTEALNSIVLKVFEKHGAPKIKNEIKGEFSAESEKARITQELAEKYPDIVKPGSSLFKKAQEYYAKLPAGIKDTPYGTKLAVKDAAEELGISPITKSRVASDEALIHSADGGPSHSENRIKKERETVMGFADMFGLSKEKMEKGIKHYESVKAGKRV